MILQQLTGNGDKRSPRAVRGPWGRRVRLAQFFVCLFVGFQVVGGGSSKGLAAEANTRPNVLFIFSDDHALQAIGAYGSKINQTPHIDRIAREGGVFLNSFCANSLCGPSRACILTGKHSHANGFRRNGNVFDSRQTTFPPLMQKVGYQTALIGKWHLETDPVGFDYWEILPGQGNYYNPDFIQMNGSRKRFEGYCTDLITDKALQWLQHGRDPNKPFVMMCQHKAPHRNWAPAPRHFSMFPDDLPEPPTLRDDYSGRTSLLQENEMTLRRHLQWGHDLKFHGTNEFPEHFASGIANGEYERMNPEQRAAWDAHYGPENEAFLTRLRAGQLSDDQVFAWKYQRYLKDYLKCVAAVDEGIGRMLDYLDQTGLAKNTIVIYASDQGFYLGDHGWYDKRWMFEESLKMPFVIRWPQVIEPGIKSTALIQNIDYGPTFLEAAGIPIPPEMQGKSLLPVLRQGGEAPAGWRDAIYYAYYENADVHAVPIHDGVRNDRYKLMYFPRGSEWQLFDLKVDPQELRSLHDDPKYAEVMKGMQQRYRDLRDYYDVNSAVIPQSRGDEAWWRDRDRQVTTAAKTATANLVFIGDSITQGWEDVGQGTWNTFYRHRQPFNLGFSGDRTEHVIWRLTGGNLGKIRPQVAVLHIGTNNTGHLMQSPRQVGAGIDAILKLLKERLPQTKILLLGIFPRGNGSLDPMRLNNRAINDIAQRFHDGERVHYLDIGDAFLEPDGTISPAVMPDQLHLSAEGYRRWAEAIEPKLREFGL